MTTEQAVQTGPCDETRCGECGEPESHVYHGDTQKVGHPFEPHLCDIACSARFYREAMGWSVWEAYPYDAERRRWVYSAPDLSVIARSLPDIMGDPSSAESWLAMRDVLAEIERRDWTAIIETASTPGDFNVILLGGDDGPNCPPLATVHNEPAPRAVALAAWAASSSSEALAEGD